MTPRTRPVLLAASLLLALTAATPAQAAKTWTACKGIIKALPAEISTPGTWCLASNLATDIATGSAITISADNVTIDCSGFSIDGSAAGAATQATGIAAVDRQDATVRNCSLRGFQYGIALTGNGSSLHHVEDNRVSGSTSMGISVAGTGSEVRGNTVIDTANLYNAVGISAYGSMSVLDNTVIGVAASPAVGNGYGIYMAYGDGATIAGNRVSKITGGSGGNGSGTTVGIFVYISNGVVLRDNVAIGTPSNASDYGFYCYSGVCTLQNSTALNEDFGWGLVGNGGGNSDLP